MRERCHEPSGRKRKVLLGHKLLLRPSSLWVPKRAAARVGAVGVRARGDDGARRVPGDGGAGLGGAAQQRCTAVLERMEAVNLVMPLLPAHVVLVKRLAPHVTEQHLLEPVAALHEEAIQFRRYASMESYQTS